MLYTVELNFTDPARAAEWNAWYETYLAQLVSLPGLLTAQRFRAVVPGAQPWEYLALYSVASLDVFASEAYRSIGGGDWEAPGRRHRARWRAVAPRHRRARRGNRGAPQSDRDGGARRLRPDHQTLCLVLCSAHQHGLRQEEDIHGPQQALGWHLGHCASTE